MNKKTRKKGIEERVRGRGGGGVKRITEISEGVEWKGEGRKAREVEISRRRKIVIRGEGKKKCKVEKREQMGRKERVDRGK
jgi:hypothetical protein